MCYKQYILFFRPAFVLGVWNWYLLGRGCLRDQSWIKALGTESLMSFAVLLYPLLEERNKSCVMALGEDSGSFLLLSSGFNPLCLFPVLILLCVFSL